MRQSIHLISENQSSQGGNAKLACQSQLETGGTFYGTQIWEIEQIFLTTISILL